MDQLKYCPCCESDRPLGEFGVNRRAPDDVHYYCKTCCREKAAASKARIAAAQAALDLGRAISLARESADALEVRVMKAVSGGARTRTEIALTAGNGDPRLARALTRSTTLRERLLASESGTPLTEKESYWQSLLLTDEFCLALGQLVQERKVRRASVNGAQIYFSMEAKPAAVDAPPQRSLFSLLVHSLGPQTVGVSAPCRRAEQRAQPEKWKAPARSRVALTSSGGLAAGQRWMPGRGSLPGDCSHLVE